MERDNAYTDDWMLVTFLLNSNNFIRNQVIIAALLKHGLAHTIVEGAVQVLSAKRSSMSVKYPRTTDDFGATSTKVFKTLNTQNLKS